MLIFRGGNWPEHKNWAVATGALTVAAIVWYAYEGVKTGAWPGGSSPPGLVFAVVGGLIIVFEMLLWARKKKRVWRVGRAKYWMKAHIWLGFLVLPLFLMHSGFRLTSGPLSSVLMVLFLAVIVSGVWGLALQQSLPKMMLDSVPGETIHSQISRILGLMLEEARRMVNVTCGREELVVVGAAVSEAEIERKAFRVVGAIRDTGSISGMTVNTQAPATFVPGSETLAEFFDDYVAPYLSAKRGGGLPLGSQRRAAQKFLDLRSRLDPATTGVVDTLSEFCEQRRQFDTQARIHGWLHGWLCVHLPLSVAMFVLMIVHTFVALYNI